MAKDAAVGKRAIISEAQQTTLLVVLGASLMLGAAISLISHFARQISFNIEVISKQDEAIVNYSNTIKNTGLCLAPKGDTYTEEELNNCDPGNIASSEVPDTLRANILEKMANNEALNSVPNASNPVCRKPETNEQYTYSELKDNLDQAESSNDSNKKAAALQLMKSCSALRVIPDALPAFKNEEALLSSLNKLFYVSGWEPENLSPSGAAINMDLPAGLNALSVNVSVEADTSTTMTVLNSIERSIREFNMEHATIEWGSNNTLQLQAQATAYYMEKSGISESTVTLSAEGD